MEDGAPKVRHVLLSGVGRRYVSLRHFDVAVASKNLAAYWYGRNTLIVRGSLGNVAGSHV
jgi:hypothetical protein